MVFLKRLSRAKGIADSPEGMDHLDRKITIDLAAQAVDQDVDDVGLGIEVIIPDMLQDHRLRDGSAGVSHQIVEQGELFRLKLDLPSAAGDLPREEVELQLPHGQTGRLLDRPGGAADQRLQTGQQLREGEWFDEVDVSSGLKPLHPVVDGALRAENQD